MHAGDVLTVGVTVGETMVHLDLLEIAEITPRSGEVVARSGRSLMPRQQLPRQLHGAASVPIHAYHFCMVADTARNVAYRRAVERAVRRRSGTPIPSPHL